jgi:hypothetical protein
MARRQVIDDVHCRQRTPLRLIIFYELLKKKMFDYAHTIFILNFVAQRIIKLFVTLDSF